MNKAILHGNVGKDPDVKHLESGKCVAKFSLATTRTYKDKDGNRQSDWHNIIAWGKIAELCEKFVKKGSSLIVVGEINYREYIDRDGVKRNVTEIVCSEIHFAGKKESSPTALDLSAKTSASRNDEVIASHSDINELPGANDFDPFA
jgi:single-strand DNA-binding protein